MPRARILKPGFFKNEVLATLPFETRLCFEGLWTVADRRGRLLDKPLRIKAEVFPYDNVDMDAMLQQLATHGFIVRYQVNGEAYIAMPTFGNHQHPHVNEQESTIPPPPKTRGNGQARGAYGEHRSSTRAAPAKHESSTDQASCENVLIRSLDPESLSGVRSLDPDTESESGSGHHPSAPLRGASPLAREGRPPLKGSRRLKKNLAAAERAAAHILARGKR